MKFGYSKKPYGLGRIKFESEVGHTYKTDREGLKHYFKNIVDEISFTRLFTNFF